MIEFFTGSYLVTSLSLDSLPGQKFKLSFESTMPELPAENSSETFDLWFKNCSTGELFDEITSRF
jgi:hypothetical protein